MKPNVLPTTCNQSDGMSFGISEDPLPSIDREWLRRIGDLEQRLVRLENEVSNSQDSHSKPSAACINSPWQVFTPGR